jgi:predicted naringenin-chalcone synthase
LSNILSIGTALPAYRHAQEDIREFMRIVYALDPVEERKLRYLYQHSGISFRYSVIPDYSRPVKEWKFYPHAESLEPFPSLEMRMAWYQKYAAALSMDAIRNCLQPLGNNAPAITHLLTVSCTGMSAPGLDLQVMELMELPRDIHRSSVNFMGCYAAIHALKQAHQICTAEPEANVLIVCTELCTLHFQKNPTADNIAASLLFGDGAAAVLVSGASKNLAKAKLKNFYAEVLPKGKRDMSWELSSTGFLMTLSGYVPELISADFKPLLERALKRYGIPLQSIHSWCIHPGGKRILHAVQQSVGLEPPALNAAESILRDYGNMSSPSILFVMKKMLEDGAQGPMLAAAFGPGLTMETSLLEIA